MSHSHSSESHPHPDKLLEFLNGDLATDEEQGIDLHLDDCAQCRELVEEVIRSTAPSANQLSDIFLEQGETTLEALADEGLEQPVQEAIAEFDKDENLVVQKEIARGGMGIVYLAYDTRLNRHVAVKVVISLDPSSSKTGAVRFRREAMITGQMQHPGVPPVHQLGKLRDGRPFIAMKLVDGKTLKEVMSNRKDVSNARLVEIFSQVCNTMAYSHSKGIIHRDLKPDNIMVGKFGEVLIMDWGLAKRINADPEIQFPSELFSSVNALEIDGELIQEDTETRFGTVVGTPGYMPPEQALGLPLDKRADVFALGGILYEVLTGFFPFDESTPNQALKLTAKGDLSELFDKLDNCDGDGTLIEIAKNCLRPKSENRFADAVAVNDELNRYLQARDEAIRKAEIKQAQTSQKLVLERKRRRQVMALAIGIAFVFVCATLAIIMYLTEKNATMSRRLERESRVWRLLGDINNLKTVASNALLSDREQLWTEALIQVRKVEAMIEDAKDPVLLKKFETARKQVVSGAQEAENEKRQRLLDQQMIDAVNDAIARSHYPNELLQLVSQQPIADAMKRAFLRYGVAHGGDISKATARIDNSQIKAELLLGLRFWRIQCVRLNKRELAQWIARLENSADPDPFRVHLRSQYFRPEGKAMDIALQSPETMKSKLTMHLLVDCLQQFKDQRAARRILELAHFKWPDDFEINFLLGAKRSFYSDPDYRLAAKNFAICHALQPDNPGVLANLTMVAIKNGDLENAIEYAEQVAKLVPKYPHSYVNLAAAWHERVQFAKALMYCKKAIETDPYFANAYYNQSVILYDMKRFNEAVDSINEAILLEPNNDAHYVKKAQLLIELNKHDEFLDTISEVERLAPTNPDSKLLLADHYYKCGNLAKSIGYLREVLKSFPNHYKARYRLSMILINDGKIPEATAVLMDTPTSSAASILLRPLAIIRQKQDRPEEAIFLLRILDRYSAEGRELLKSLEKEQGKGADF